MNAVVEFIDDNPHNQVSALWHELNEKTRARILGLGGALSIALPVTRIKLLYEIKNYLKSIEQVSRSKLVSDMESIGLTIKGQSPDFRFMEFVDKRGIVRAKIHPPDKVTSYHHLHIYDRKQVPLDKNLEHANPRSPEAHIKISEGKE